MRPSLPVPLLAPPRPTLPTSRRPPARSRQRRNILGQILRQVAGDQQSRNPVFVADCHPACPTNSLGQKVILEGAAAVPWQQQLLVQVGEGRGRGGGRGPAEGPCGDG